MNHLQYIFDYFTTVLSKLEKGLKEMNIPDSEVAGNIGDLSISFQLSILLSLVDSPSDFSTDQSGNSQRRH